LYVLRDAEPDFMAEVTVGLLLRMLGHAYEFPSGTERLALVRLLPPAPLSVYGIEKEAEITTMAIGRLPASAHPLSADANSRGSQPATLETDERCFRWSEGCGPLSSCSLSSCPPPDLYHKFVTDAEYREIVYSTFERLLQPDLVSCITYNPVFGRLWRLVCTRKGEPRVRALQDLMSRSLNHIASERAKAVKATKEEEAKYPPRQCIPKPIATTSTAKAVKAADDADKAVKAIKVQVFLQASYDQSDRIRNIVSGALVSGALVSGALVSGALVSGALVSGALVSRKELLDLERSCSPETLRRVTALLTRLRRVEMPTRKMPDGVASVRMLPAEGLSLSDLFGILPHLMVRGTMFGRRGVARVACVCVIARCALLEEAALRHLGEIRGAWINMTAPEDLSMEFARLVLAADDASDRSVVLTPEERAFLLGAFRVHAVAINGLTSVSAALALSPPSAKPAIMVDRKAPCDTCGVPRLLSLLTDDSENKSKCALCIDGGRPIGAKALAPAASTAVDRSIVCRCADCAVMYALVNSELLRARPKCFFCRFTTNGLEKDTVPPLSLEQRSRECVSCGNRHQRQRAADLDPSDAFVCPPCEEAKRAGKEAATEIVEILAGDYLRQNGTEFLGVRAPDLGLLFQSRSMFQSVTRGYATCDEEEKYATFDGRRVLNRAEVEATISGWVERGVSERGTCAICYSEVPKRELRPACGKTKGRFGTGRCGTGCCESCLHAWYAAAQPGRCCAPTHLACPFCKRVPRIKALLRYNPEMVALRNLKDVATLDPAWVHAWCVDCQTLAPAMERACGNNQSAAVQAVTRFVCQPCQEVRDEAVREETAVRLIRAVRAAAAVDRDGDGGDVRTEDARTPLEIGKTMECPGCGVVTEKTFGCNHMTCTCGQGARNADGVYDHIARVHNADIFGGPVDYEEY